MKHPKTLLTGQLARPAVPFFGKVLGSIWNRRNKALNDVAFTQVRSSQPVHVLEIGFGGGYLLQRLLSEDKSNPEKHVSGIDHSYAMAQLCRKRFRRELLARRLNLAIASIESIPYNENAFDCVVSVNSIFYWKNPVRAISEISRVLLPGGRLVLIFTCQEDLNGPALDRNVLGLYQPEQISGWVEDADFTRLEFQQHQDPRRHFLSLQAVKG